uniref:Uncharacterized protein n=1 Tax=Anguilla anguilla TaxID=7936 RepID=A0A0E9PQD7_ANGAN
MHWTRSRNTPWTGHTHH